MLEPRNLNLVIRTHERIRAVVETKWQLAKPQVICMAFCHQKRIITNYAAL